MEEVIKVWLWDPLMGKLIASLVAVVVILGVVRFLQRSLTRYVQNSVSRYRARKFITFLGYLAGIGVVLTVFSDRLGGLTVALGVAGAGIAFALQEVIASVAGWLAVSFGGFYQVSDRIQLGGIRGDVIDIGVLRTTLMECGEWIKGDQYTGRIVRIANSFVFKEPVFNYSADFPFLWDEIMVPFKYGSDYTLARQILQQVGGELVARYADQFESAWQQIQKKYAIENQTLEPTVTLVANQNWLEFTLRYVVDYKLRRSTKDQLFRRILEEVDRTEGRVGIAASTLNIEKMVVNKIPPLEVKISAGP
jgi:small-conductance mechanosensitive channel